MSKVPGLIGLIQRDEITPDDLAHIVSLTRDKDKASIKRPINKDTNLADYLSDETKKKLPTSVEATISDVEVLDTLYGSKGAGIRLMKVEGFAIYKDYVSKEEFIKELKTKTPIIFKAIHDGVGLNIADLLKKFQEMQGKPIPLPSPKPTPTPAPAPIKSSPYLKIPALIDSLRDLKNKLAEIEGTYVKTTTYQTEINSVLENLDKAVKSIKLNHFSIDELINIDDYISGKKTYKGLTQKEIIDRKKQLEQLKKAFGTSELEAKIKELEKLIKKDPQGKTLIDYITEIIDSGKLKKEKIIEALGITDTEWTALKKLKSEHDTLRKEYNTLKTEHDLLKTEHDKIRPNFNASGALTSDAVGKALGKTGTEIAELVERLTDPTRTDKFATQDDITGIYNDLKNSLILYNTRLTNLETQINTELTAIKDHITAELAKYEPWVKNLEDQYTLLDDKCTILDDLDDKIASAVTDVDKVNDLISQALTDGAYITEDQLTEGLKNAGLSAEELQYLKEAVQISRQLKTDSTRLLTDVTKYSQEVVGKYQKVTTSYKSIQGQLQGLGTELAKLKPKTAEETTKKKQPIDQAAAQKAAIQRARQQVAAAA